MPTKQTLSQAIRGRQLAKRRDALHRAARAIRFKRSASGTANLLLAELIDRDGTQGIEGRCWLVQSSLASSVSGISPITARRQLSVLEDAGVISVERRYPRTLHAWPADEQAAWGKTELATLGGTVVLLHYDVILRLGVEAGARTTPAEGRATELAALRVTVRMLAARVAELEGARETCPADPNAEAEKTEKDEASAKPTPIRSIAFPGAIYRDRTGESARELFEPDAVDAVRRCAA